jgi:hypothetical protein
VYRSICRAVKHLIYSYEEKQSLFCMATAQSHFKKKILNGRTNVVLVVATSILLIKKVMFLKVYRSICRAVKHLIYSHEEKQSLFCMANAHSHFKKEILNRRTNAVLVEATSILLIKEVTFLKVYRSICRAVKHLIYVLEEKQLLFCMATAHSHFKKEILNRRTNVVLVEATSILLIRKSNVSESVPLHLSSCQASYLFS